MIRLVYCLTRRPHLSREAFLRRWREVHGPLVREHAAAATPEGRRAGRALLDDERAFIELKSSPIWLGEPHVVVGR